MNTKQLFAASCRRWNALLDYAVQALAFWSCAAWSSLARWWTVKRMCAWCKPHRWIGGNPFARQVTHGICPACLAQQVSNHE